MNRGNSVELAIIGKVVGGLIFLFIGIWWSNRSKPKVDR